MLGTLCQTSWVLLDDSFFLNVVWQLVVQTLACTCAHLHPHVFHLQFCKQLETLHIMSALQQEVQRCKCCIVLFDKSEMDGCPCDVYDSPQRAVTRYFTSLFLGQSTGENIQDRLLEALELLPLGKMIDFHGQTRCELEVF